MPYRRRTMAREACGPSRPRARPGPAGMTPNRAARHRRCRGFLLNPDPSLTWLEIADLPGYTRPCRAEWYRGCASTPAHSGFFTQSELLTSKEPITARQLRI